MECGRQMIYFSAYENGRKIGRAGYAAIFIRGNVCDMQLYYRGREIEAQVRELKPIYLFYDGTVTEGAIIFLEEGMAATTVHTSRQDFMQSGRALEELEAIYLDGVASGICGGRPDGQELTGEEAYTLTDWMDTVSETIPVCGEEPEEIIEVESGEDAEVRLLQEEEKKAPEIWTLSEFSNRLPELKLPLDSVRKKCYRMTLEDLEHLPEEWEAVRENHFLLHAYYEYQHLLFVHLSCRCGTRYAIGIPGEFCYRNQYMAECFGCYDFAPLEPGKCRGGSFGYWYYYLEN